MTGTSTVAPFRKRLFLEHTKFNEIHLNKNIKILISLLPVVEGLKPVLVVDRILNPLVMTVIP